MGSPRSFSTRIPLKMLPLFKDLHFCIPIIAKFHSYLEWSQFLSMVSLIIVSSILGCMHYCHIKNIFLVGEAKVCFWIR
jgi:hypothetical protein